MRHSIVLMSFIVALWESFHSMVCGLTADGAIPIIRTKLLNIVGSHAHLDARRLRRARNDRPGAAIRPGSLSDGGYRRPPAHPGVLPRAAPGRPAQGGSRPQRAWSRRRARAVAATGGADPR